MLRGETATIYTPTVTYDEAKDEIAEYTPVTVGNVLFGRPTTEQYDEAMRLYGVRAQYTLGIPKTYTASLRGCYVTRARDASVASTTTTTGGEPDDSPKYWIAGDPQPLPAEICPTPWNREAIAGWVDG